MTADEYLYEVLASQALGDDSDEIKALQKHRAEVETVLQGFVSDYPICRLESQGHDEPGVL
jgi:hypothetical protein